MNIDAGTSTLRRFGQRLPIPIKALVLKLYWLGYDARDALAAWVGWVPSHIVRRAMYRWMLRIQIGQDSSIHWGCRFYNPPGVCIGHDSVINRAVVLDGRYPLQIGNHVSISEAAMLLTLEHDPDSPTFENRGSPIIIGDYVFIGTRAIILPGVEIGAGAVVAAGAVVTKNVPANHIVAGVPARFLRMRRANLEYTIKYSKFLG